MGLGVGKVDLEILPGMLAVSVDDLEGNKLVIRGRAEISGGKIGAVLISLDGGDTWKKANLDPNGAFNFEFRPDFGREYDLRVKAVATTGKSSGYENDAFPFMIERNRSEDEVKETFLAMLRNYTNENRGEFMSFVSDDFEGDLNSLEDAIEDDFRFFDNIIIKPNITRVISLGSQFQISFTYDRMLQSTTTGKVLTHRAASNMTFKRTGDGFKLIAMAAPLLFGVSNVDEVATTIEEASIGTAVIVVNQDTGVTTKPTLQDTVEDTVIEQEAVEEAHAEEDAFASTTDVRTGAATLQCSFESDSPTAGSCQGFIFSSQSIASGNNTEDVFHSRMSSADFAPYVDRFSSDPNPVFSTSNGAELQDLGFGSLSSVTTVSTSGYQESLPDGGPKTTIVSGRLYEFRTDDTFYAVIKVTSVSSSVGEVFDPATMDHNEALTPSTVSMSFQYKVQMNGEPRFE